MTETKEEECIRIADEIRDFIRKMDTTPGGVSKANVRAVLGNVEIYLRQFAANGEERK